MYKNVRIANRAVHLEVDKPLLVKKYESISDGLKLNIG